MAWLLSRFDVRSRAYAVLLRSVASSCPVTTVGRVHPRRELRNASSLVSLRDLTERPTAVSQDRPSLTSLPRQGDVTLDGPQVIFAMCCALSRAGTLAQTPRLAAPGSQSGVCVLARNAGSITAVRQEVGGRVRVSTARLSLTIGPGHRVDLHSIVRSGPGCGPGGGTPPGPPGVLVGGPSPSDPTPSRPWHAATLGVLTRLATALAKARAVPLAA